MAYAPRTDLLTPSVAPETQGYGPGLSAGVSNFASLVTQGLTAKRQDARDTKIWEQTLQRDKANYDRNYSMLDRKEGMREQKELAGKQEEADFASSAWETIRQQMPDVITPEMNDKFVSGSLGTKRGLLVQGQAAFTRALAKQQEEEKAKRDSQPFADYIPGTGKVVFGRGRNVMGSADAFNNAAPLPAGEGANMWEGQAPLFGDVPESPSYFNNMPDRPVKPSARPALAPNPATPAPPAKATSPRYYYGR